METATRPLVTATEIAFYQANGFVRLEAALSPERVQDLREAIDAVYRNDRGGIHNSAGRSAYARVLDQRVNLWRDDEVVRAHVFDARLAEAARLLCGAAAVRLWHDHALLKQPGDSKPTPWHQDLPYWPMQQPGALSCWVALDDVDEHNGALLFLPRTHRLGSLPPVNLTDPQDLLGMVSQEALGGEKPALQRLTAGSCTFHDGLTFHAAGANHTAAARRAMVTIYMPDGTTFSGKRHVVTDGQGLQPGQALAGELFPVLG